uniref:Ig-like domain-containing protein n=1 Tax=Vombatus ursinus TaxID=29139 RepID=A0A4X2JRY0_VOMUR
MTKYYLWFLLFYLFTEPRASRENDAPVMVTGILGESAILPTEIPNGYKLENINWASRTSVALVQPEGQSVKIITTHQNYRDRLNVPPNTYNLKISPLKMEDAGSYRADINLQNPTTSTTFTITKNYTLHVYSTLVIFDPFWYTLLSVLEMVIVIILTGMGFYLRHKKKQEPRASRENDAPVMVTGILGESAILPTEIPNGYKLENINWASRTSVALVQPEGQSVKIITTHQNYRDRLNVPPNTYNLKISPLKMEDAGSYRADINLQNPTTSTTFTVTKNYTLHVYRRLAPPKITLTFVASENNTCNITLTCFMEEKGEAVKYQWTPLGEQAVESNGKSSLFIFQRPEDAPINYICTAINPVTNNSQSKLVQYPCAGMPMSSRSLWFILVPVLVLVPSAGILFYLQHKKKKDADSPSTSKVMALKDLPLSENQLYDEISMPKAIVSNPPKEEEALNTIYYTVQKPQKIKNSCSSATKLLGTSTNDSVI